MSNEMVLRARVLLLDEGRTDANRLDPAAELRAYRVLAPVSPLVYRRKLALALVAWVDSPAYADRPELRLALLREAVDAADGMPADAPFRTAVLLLTLDAAQRHLADTDTDPDTAAAADADAAADTDAAQAQIDSLRARIATLTRAV